MKVTANYTYSETQDEYIIKLKKRRYWWLLLLLLPLLLLLVFNKNVKFKTIDAAKENPLQSTFVKFSYIDRYLFNFKTASFFSTDTISLKNTTDKNGIVEFKDISYSLFSYLFFRNETALVIAVNSCYSGDSIQPKFHSLKNNKEIILKLPYKSYDLDFIVVDNDDGQPLPDSKVFAKCNINGTEIEWEELSDVAGLVSLKNVPYCANIEVIGRKYGYLDDTIINKVKNITGNIENHRTLRLKPKKTILKFIVRDLKTKELIPNAKASLKIEGKTISSVRTNTNGVGIGVFDDIHVLAKFTLLVQKSFYYDTSKTDIVDKFMKYDEAGRTIYLRPKKQNISFRNINSKTKAPISGVKNEISVNGKALSEFEYSNSSGNFVISGVFPDDLISIKSTKSGYKLNNYTIRNKKFSNLLSAPQSARDIPLEPIPPPPPPPGPRKNCRVFFTGLIVGDEFIENNISEIYRVDKYSEYVGDGEYPDNSITFPKSVKYTFDGIAIDKGTRVIIYSGKNFTGSVLLDKTGPAIINNKKWKNDSRYSKYNTKTYKASLQSNFPQSVREWSKTNMQSWSNGSVKVICK